MTLSDIFCIFLFLIGITREKLSQTIIGSNQTAHLGEIRKLYSPKEGLKDETEILNALRSCRPVTSTFELLTQVVKIQTRGAFFSNFST